MGEAGRLAMVVLGVVAVLVGGGDGVLVVPILTVA